MSQVDNLKKIFLAFRAGTSADTMDLHPSPPEFNFILGIATGGMTPFEYELIDKSKGDTIAIHLEKKDYKKFFEHLQPPLWELFDGRSDIFLQVDILDVTPADNREIISAMTDIAKQGESGCDGDCGCGCG